MTDQDRILSNAVATIRGAITALKQAGRQEDARNLSNDLIRSGDFLPEVLMTRDDAERLLASL